MNCSWKERDAYRFVEGTLDAARREAYGAHLAGCAACQARVATARRLEDLLQGAVTPVAAPATLASRVVNAVAAEREERRARVGLRLFGRRLSPLLAGVAAALVLAVASYAVAPGAVMALAQRVLFFVPGLGIKPAAEGTLVATAPVTVRSGSVTLTVEALLSDGKETMVRFELRGLPGGKEGWDTQQPGARKPVLRDGEGREYAMQMSATGVGGSPEENIVTSEMHFPPLPAGLESVDVVVPLELYVPSAVVAGLQQAELTAHVALVPPDESDLPAATPQSAEATVSGVSLKVTASSAEAGRTVVLLEGEAAGAAGQLTLGRVGGDPADAATLRDDRGRTYKLVQQTWESELLTRSPLHRDLYFEPVAAGAQQLTLTVPAVQVVVEGSADVTIPLAGRQLGETFELNRTVDLGGYEVACKSATLATEQDPLRGEVLYLYVDVELPAAADGRMLAWFGVSNARTRGWYGTPTGGVTSMGSRGEQADRFRVPVEAGAAEVIASLDYPIVVVEGPWELSFPVGQ